MRLGTRNDDDQGRTRTVVWSGGGETDLGPLVAVSLALSICIACIVLGLGLHGLPHAVASVVAVLSGIYAALIILPMLLVLGGVLVVKGMLADKPSAAQRASWLAAAGLLGAILGSDTYSVGIPGLLTGPILMAIVVPVLRSRPDLSPRARRRAVELCGVTAAVALGVGVTIFL